MVAELDKQHPIKCMLKLRGRLRASDKVVQATIRVYKVAKAVSVERLISVDRNRTGCLPAVEQTNRRAFYSYLGLRLPEESRYIC